MNINFNNKKLILLPATITCIISLLLVYKFTFPISWDVYYHIHMANLYMTNGLVFWDYSTVAPHGRLIIILNKAWCNYGFSWNVILCNI